MASCEGEAYANEGRYNFPSLPLVSFFIPHTHCLPIAEAKSKLVSVRVAIRVYRFALSLGFFGRFLIALASCNGCFQPIEAGIMGDNDF